MSIFENIKSSISESMKAKDEVRLTTLRGVLSSCTNELVAKGKKPQDLLSDEEVLAVISRLAKQRKDSIDQFTKGNRPDLALGEKAELEILESYLPKQMEKSEVEVIARAKQAELGITDKSGAGKLMSSLMQELRGKADGTLVKDVVDSLLG